MPASRHEGSEGATDSEHEDLEVDDELIHELEHMEAVIPSDVNIFKPAPEPRRTRSTAATRKDVPPDSSEDISGEGDGMAIPAQAEIEVGKGSEEGVEVQYPTLPMTTTTTNIMATTAPATTPGPTGRISRAMSRAGQRRGGGGSVKGGSESGHDKVSDGKFIPPSSVPIPARDSPIPRSIVFHNFISPEGVIRSQFG